LRLVVLVVLMLVVSIVMQRNRVELLEWICDLTTRRGQVAVQRNTLHLACVHTKALVYLGTTKIDTVTFPDISEIHSVDTAALVGYDRRL